VLSEAEEDTRVVGENTQEPVLYCHKLYFYENFNFQSYDGQPVLNKDHLFSLLFRAPQELN